MGYLFATIVISSLWTDGFEFEYFTRYCFDHAYNTYLCCIPRNKCFGHKAAISLKIITLKITRIIEARLFSAMVLSMKGISFSETY
jgi:hypothetical protein